MKCVKSGLKRLKEQLNDFTSRVLAKKEQLNIMQRPLQGNPLVAELIQLNKTVTVEYANLLRAEESFYEDKSRVQWLNIGDRNTSFSHRKVKGYNNACLAVTKHFHSI